MRNAADLRKLSRYVLRRFAACRKLVEHPLSELMQSAVDDQRDSLRVWLWTLGAYVVASVALTWPLAWRWSTHLPLGSLPDPVVPWFNLWTLEWNAERLGHAYFGYWDAPLFYPARDTFALSEPQGLTGLLYAATRPWLGAVGAYNATLGLLLVLNALAARQLARALGVSRLSASCVGAFVLALPFVQRELGVLQLCALFPVLRGLYELRAVLSYANAAALLRLCLCLVAALWTCEYYALLFATLLLPAPLFALRQGQRLFTLRQGQRLQQLLAAALSGALLVLALSWPLLAAQQRALAGFTRSAHSVHAGSTSIWAYVQPPAYPVWGNCAPGLARPPQHRSLYPGLGVVALALIGVSRMRRAPARRFLAYCGLLLAAAWLLSFGTRLKFGSFLPYQVFVQHGLPGFAQLRSPYRAGVFVQICLALFAGFGLDALAERAATRARAQWLIVTCLVLSLGEIWSGPQHTQRFEYEALHEPWIAWLARQPEGAAALVPAVEGSKVSAYRDTVLGMLQALRHGHPIVNGYSGFFPPKSDRLAELLANFPAANCLGVLRHVGVRYVVVDKSALKARGRALPSAGPGLELVYDTPARSVFVVGASPD